VIKIRINILFGVLILAAIVTILVPQTDIVKLSPSTENQYNYKFDTELGVLHSNCATACLKLDECQTSSSYKKGNLYFCECNDCVNSKRPIILTSTDRINFK